MEQSKWSVSYEELNTEQRGVPTGGGPRGGAERDGMTAVRKSTPDDQPRKRVIRGILMFDLV